MIRLATVTVTLLALLVSLAQATAPTLYIIPPDQTLTTVAIRWTAVPTSPDVACAETIYLDYLSFSTGATARTVTATDAQGSPITWLTAVPLAANQFTVIAIPQGGKAVLFGGFSISASGSGVVYQFSGRVKR